MSDEVLDREVCASLSDHLDDLHSTLMSKASSHRQRFTLAKIIAESFVHRATIEASFASKAKDLESPLPAHVLDNLKFVLEQIEESLRPDLIKGVRDQLRIVKTN